jgi:hypothetical protein
VYLFEPLACARVGALVQLQSALAKPTKMLAELMGVMVTFTGQGEPVGVAMFALVAPIPDEPL